MMTRSSRGAAVLAAVLGGGLLAVASWEFVRRRRRRRDARLRRLCQLLPKAELHAHLHGCAHLSTIAELAPPGVDTRSLLPGAPGSEDRSLDACFAVFGAIHKTVTTLSAIRRIAREVISAFAADNVKYLELRTTPRDLLDADVEGYVRCVLAILVEHSTTCTPDPWPMSVRLLLSIDRTGSLDKALATVRLAIKLMHDVDSGGAAHIAGIDFSGNPTRNSFADFVPAFDEARAAGLRISVHTAEVDNPSDTASILRFRPDRLGHALLLSRSDLAQLQSAPIPIELCPTSNLKTLRLRRLSEHPTLRRLLSAGYPVSISTDDSTVFSTSPSEELFRAASLCDLDDAQVVRLAAAAWVHCFESDEAVRARWRLKFEEAAFEALAESRKIE